MKTIPALLMEAVAEDPQKVFIRWVHPEHPEAPPVDITFAEFGVLVRKAIRALQDCGIGEGDRVLFLSENSPAWQALAIAAQCLNAIPAALFSNLGPAEIASIAERVQPKAIFLSGEHQWHKIQLLLSQIPFLRVVITEFGEVAVPSSYRHVSIAELESLEPVSKEEFSKKSLSVSLEDLFLIIFTSGTTGRQKGVQFTQRAFAVALIASEECVGVHRHDVGLLTLPFAHVTGQIGFHVGIKTHCQLIFCSKATDIFRGFYFSPSYTLLVPLFYERIWKGVLGIVDQKKFFLSGLLQWALAKCTTPNSSNVSKKLGTLIASGLVGRSLKKKFGGKMRVLVSGGAPSDPRMVKFFRSLGFEYLDGYGMSETSGIIAVNRFGDKHLKIGSVGRPWRGMEIRTSEDGEILVKGPTLMKGYIDEEDNREAFTEDGFFRTGDLGCIDADGYLFITGRKKNIIVLSTGKKVAPEPIEQKLVENLPITGAVLLQDGKSFISAALFVAPEQMDRLRRQSASEGVETHLVKMIRYQLDGLSDYEIPKKTLIIEGAPGDYPDLLTPTLKIKREAFAKKFADKIHEIYKK